MPVHVEELRAFLAGLKSCRDYSALRAKLMDDLGKVMPARAYGLYRLDGNLQPNDVAAQGVPDTFLLRYEEAGRSNDPMMASIIRSHLPTHNLKVLSPQQWLRHPLYRHLTSRLAGLEHVLQAPLLGDGRIIGTLNFGRMPGEPPFGDEELALASVVAHHVSALMARLPDGEDALCLTRRELEVADLVAAGLNNKEIGHCLSISRNTVKETLKRIFRKLEVDSRAELAARLAKARPATGGAEPAGALPNRAPAK
jgi:DNA-binding CsgD family transcriptional regulator